MKARKILCILSVLTMAMSTGACNSNTELFKTSTESSTTTSTAEHSDDTPANYEDSGELVPKINAVSRPETNNIWNSLKGITADEAINTFDVAEGAIAEEDVAVESPHAETSSSPYFTADDDIIAGDWYDDDYKDDIQVQPQAGLLTAGVWNDNDNWGFFTNLVNNDKITIPEQYGLKPTNRVEVTVTDKNTKPVVNAKVKGFTDKGELVWTAVTDKNGTAYLFNGDKILDLEIESQGKTVKESLRIDMVEVHNDEQTIMKTSNTKITVIFDGDGKNYQQTEIMFVVDTTGSMGDELMFLQSEFTAIAEEVGTENTRFSINFYRDEYDDYTTKRYPFSSNIEEIQKKLNSEYAAGGGDLPEAVAEVLDETINDGGWSDESVKLMFMIFDAPPHNDKAQVLESAIKTAAEKGIRIIPVVSSNSDRDTEIFGRSAAIMTGGTYIFLTDDSGIGSSHLEPIIGEYKVEKLYDIIIRTINEYKQGDISVTDKEEQVSENSDNSSIEQ